MVNQSIYGTLGENCRLQELFCNAEEDITRLFDETKAVLASLQRKYEAEASAMKDELDEIREITEAEREDDRVRIEQYEKIYQALLNVDLPLSLRPDPVCFKPDEAIAIIEYLAKGKR